MDSKQIAAIEKYAAALWARTAEYEKQNFPSVFAQSPTTITIDYGRKYARIVRNSHGQRSVHSFIEIATGNVLKAATWNAPAKIVRGNINAKDKGMSACTVYGANYIR